MENEQLTKELVEEISAARNEPTWLLKKRLHAFDKFESLPLPAFKYGLSIIIDPNLDFSKIDFSKLAEHKAEPLPAVMHFTEALESYSDVVKKYFLQFEYRDSIDAFNAAFFTDAYLYYVPKNKTVEKPVQLQTKATFPHVSRLLIVAEDNSNLDFISKSSSTGSGFRCDYTEVIVGKNTKVNYADIQNLSDETYNFSNKYGRVLRDGTINWLSCCLGSIFTKELVFTDLAGKGATTNNYGFFFGSKNQQFDISATTQHSAPYTVCDMATKGIVTDSAKAIYQGLVRIESTAPKSNGYQKEDVLILAETAEAYSIPQLEIENNDVRCTHGASIGQIDKEKLFYIMSRGLDEKSAERKIVEGFFEPMITKIHTNLLQEDIRKIIIERMEK